MMAVWEVEEGIQIEQDKKIAIELRSEREAKEAKIFGGKENPDIELPILLAQ